MSTTNPTQTTCRHCDQPIARMGVSYWHTSPTSSRMQRYCAGVTEADLRNTDAPYATPATDENAAAR